MPKQSLLYEGDVENDETDRDTFLRQSLEIEPDQLNKEFIRVPGQLAYWNGQYAEAYKAAGLAKINYDRAWAQLYCALKAQQEGSKKPFTVDHLKALVDNDEDLHNLQMEVVIAEAEKLRLRGICEAVAAKKDMVQSLGAKFREEMRGDPMLRSNQLTG